MFTKHPAVLQPIFDPTTTFNKSVTYSLNKCGDKLPPCLTPRAIQKHSERKHFTIAPLLADDCTRTPVDEQLHNMMVNIDREFEFYDFFSFLKFNEFYEFFFGRKNSQKNRNFANHRCLTCFDVLECNVHL